MKDRSFGGANPAYDPKACGLEQVAYLSRPNLSYEFDECYLWRDIATRKFYFAADSGCSCPVPFERYTSLATLTPIPSRKVLGAEVKSYFGNASDYCQGPSQADIDAFVLAMKR